jgi:hypothetical protein
MQPVLTWCHLRVSLSKGDPTPDELAAIAVAYAIVAARAEEPRNVVPRWRMAARLPASEPLRARWGRATSRWNAAGRLDG